MVLAIQFQVGFAENCFYSRLKVFQDGFGSCGLGLQNNCLAYIMSLMSSFCHLADAWIQQGAVNIPEVGFVRADSAAMHSLCYHHIPKELCLLEI